MPVRAPSKPNRSRAAASPLPQHLAALVEAQFAGEPRAVAMVSAFLARNQFDRSLAEELIALARGGDRVSWNLRLFSAVLLENQCLHLGPADRQELEWLWTQLGLLEPGASTVHPDVLLQGYTSAELPAFGAEFLRKLRRREPLHRRLAGFETTAAALEELIYLSREPCKVPLARYLFTPQEVAARVRQHLLVSSGTRALLEDLGAGEANHALRQLPAYEREIVQWLTQDEEIYWSCERSGSAINSVLENPLGTVACVIKAPGSAVELEIKRTGVGGAYPLTAVYTGGDGRMVPPSHRLRGGASTASLRWEAVHAAILGAVYRIAHHTEAPISKLLALSSFRTVPCAGREVHLLDYFTDSETFGPGFAGMRQHLTQCVAAFERQYGDEFAHLPGEIGLTGRFLYHALPCQGLLAESTSYRLDTLARYLSPDGAEIYFGQGLKRVNFSCDEGRRFADALLEEVLGVYLAPEAAYLNHGQYLAAAFAVPENRRQADRFHAAAVFDFGQLWGTVLALGGHTDGESFVGRNVGLKSVFRGGEWVSRLIAMDHDNLHVPDENQEVFWPHGGLRSAEMDEAFIRGQPGQTEQMSRCSLRYLDCIYHLGGDDAPSMSRRTLEAGMAVGYRQVCQAVANDPRMERLLQPVYLRHLRDWNAAVADYLRTVSPANETEFAAWKERTESYLAEREYPEHVIKNYCSALEKHHGFVRRYSFLYLPAES